MSRKTLRFNRFGESIMSEFDLFSYSIDGVNKKYPGSSEMDPDIYQIKFKWSWNGYSGYGEIDFYKSTNSLCNKFGENYSSMTVSTNSKRQQPNGRSNCALYNDPTLIPLFEKILSKIHLSNINS